MKGENVGYKFFRVLVYMTKICYIDLTVRLKYLVLELNNLLKF